MKIIELKYDDFTEETWNRFFQFVQNYRSELTPGYPPIDKATIKEQIKANYPGRSCLNLALIDEGEYLASARSAWENSESPSYEANKHLGWIEFRILKKAYQSGAYKDFIDSVINMISKNSEITRNQIVSFEAKLDQYVEYKGGNIASTFASNHLQKSDINLKMMKQWVTKGAEKNPDLRMKLYNPIPKDLYPTFSFALTQALQDMPQDNNEREYIVSEEILGDMIQKVKKTGKILLTYAAMTPSNQVAGLTDIIYIPSQPQICYQEMTYVTKTHRGKGIGRWLKGQMALHMLENYPQIDFFDTSNANSNEHMLAINHEMGYREFMQGKIYNLEV